MKNVYMLPFVLLAFMLSVPSFAQNEVQRVRLNLETPLGYTRQLLLGFTPDNAATDDFDFGYDGANVDDFPDDFSWMINGERYIIQGVGEFDETKVYPIGFFLTNSGDVNVALHSTENFESPIDVYIYDSLNNSYHKINDSVFTLYLDPCELTDRFYIAFYQPNLSINEYESTNINISYSSASQSLTVKASAELLIEHISIYNIQSQKSKSIAFIRNNTQTMHLAQRYNGINIISIKTNRGMIFKKILF